MCLTTQIMQSSSEHNVPILINNCLSVRSGASEAGEALCSDARAVTPGLPPSRHLHFLILSYNIVANSGLANSPGRLSGCLCKSPVRVTCSVSASSLSSAGQTWTRLRNSNRLVSDKTRHQTYFDVSQEHLFRDQNK